MAKSTIRRAGHWFWMIGLGAGVLIFGAMTVGVTVYLLWHWPMHRRYVLGPFVLARVTYQAWFALRRRLRPAHPLADMFPYESKPADFGRFP